jgi:hypothetical protein
MVWYDFHIQVFRSWSVPQLIFSLLQLLRCAIFLIYIYRHLVHLNLMVWFGTGDTRTQNTSSLCHNTSSSSNNMYELYFI